MSLPDLLPIQPFAQPVRGEVTVPGSKSLTNRALLLAALCDQPVTLTGALFSEDTFLMAEALRQLGFTVETDPAAHTATVRNQSAALVSGHADLFVGLAGTAARFLTALCAALPQGTYRIDGVPQMRKRPMKPLLDALRALGADITCQGEEGFFPIEIRACGLRGGPVEIDAHESSQLLSALLLIAPLAERPVEINLVGNVRWPFVQMSTRLMEQFGQPKIAVGSGTAIRVPHGQKYHLRSDRFAIEPDATAASYFLTLPLIAGGRLTIAGLTGPGAGLQGDIEYAKVLERIGLNFRPRNVSAGVEASYALGQPRRGVAEDFSQFSDTFLTLAAAAPLLHGVTRISGIAHTRKQETDRVAGAARELTRLGQEVTETEDAIAITPRPLKHGETIETYGDHRFAMSFAILGCHDLRGDGQPWLTIRNPACCAKTFPNFFDVLDQLRAASHFA